MLRDCSDPLNLFELVPALGLATDRVLAHRDTLLDDDHLFQLVRADLSRRCPRTLSDGRPSTPVEVILRLLVVQHLYGWSYAQTEHWVSDSLVLRQFCRVYLQPVPDDTTLIRWANVIQPATLHQPLDHVVALARQLRVTRGRRLRVDSTLLGDGVRVLNRAIQRAKQLVHPASAQAQASFRDRTRSVRRVMRRLIAAGRQRGTRAEERLRGDDRHLIALTERVLHQAQEVPGLLGNISGSGWRERETLTVFIPRVEQVSTQARRRVLAGESVPASAKAVRIFEPHTAVIRKGKPGHPVEFGRVVWLDEVEGGIVSRYAVLAGNPDDAEPLAPALDHHMQRFGDAPRLLAGDRKVSSREGERSAHDQAVRRVVLPHSGRGSAQRITYERQRWFQRGRRWRTGIEGRISVRKRRHKLTRCRYHGSEGMARWVGWGVITHNLRHIAEALSSTDADAARHPIPRAANPAASSACRFRTAK